MTLSKLIKHLQKIEAAGHGRAKVTVNKPSLWDGNETFQICDVHSVKHDWVPQGDDDGFQIFNKDGQERCHSCVVICGRVDDK